MCGSMRTAASDFGLLDEFETAFVRLQGQWNQDTIQPQEFALQRLPELTLNGRKELFGNLMYADYDAQAVNFFRYKGVDGRRLDVNPRVTLPWRLGDYLYGYATVGAMANAYNTAGHDLTITPLGSRITTSAGTRETLQFNSAISEGPLSDSGVHANVVPYFKTGVATELDRVYYTGWHAPTLFLTKARLKGRMSPTSKPSSIPIQLRSHRLVLRLTTIRAAMPGLRTPTHTRLFNRHGPTLRRPESIWARRCRARSFSSATTIRVRATRSLRPPTAMDPS